MGEAYRGEITAQISPVAWPEWMQVGRALPAQSFRAQNWAEWSSHVKTENYFLRWADA